mmetsp:Transcript_27319/g.76283  ORF Transcript_27319/g.76283 Transcript_27319/m.76283 type:complete len:216 (-) Transcript_27319:1198-1845(-)
MPVVAVVALQVPEARGLHRHGEAPECPGRHLLVGLHDDGLVLLRQGSHLAVRQQHVAAALQDALRGPLHHEHSLAPSSCPRAARARDTLRSALPGASSPHQHAHAFAVAIELQRGQLLVFAGPEVAGALGMVRGVLLASLHDAGLDGGVRCPELLREHFQGGLRGVAPGLELPSLAVVLDPTVAAQGADRREGLQVRVPGRCPLHLPFVGVVRGS